MFDSVTATLLRSAPALPDLTPDSLPSILTLHYAKLVSMRLRGECPNLGEQASQRWPLEKIADAYELIASTLEESQPKRSSAFVAATAHQILSRRNKELATTNGNGTFGITREAVPPDVTSALLFLIAEQYADANEASLAIALPNEASYESQILTKNIRELACGRLPLILERSTMWRPKKVEYLSLQDHALIIMLNTLIEGVEILAADILAKKLENLNHTQLQSPENIFENVIKLAHYSNSKFDESLGYELISLYPGPRHVASLLLAVTRTLKQSSLAKIPSPNGLASPFWLRWLEKRAEKYPFLWPNHRDAVEKRFYDSGVSAVLVLPTGAGKTTVSSLKIASTLAQGKRVVFLAPTHALVDQMTVDLQKMFSNIDSGSFTEIEVMTPERCLALLSFVPETFSNVGLLVFDECHLLSPEQDNIRRSLDGMLCLLAFNSIASDADMLFLSAMLKNGEEFAKWIKSLTKRDTIYVDLLWKPSRQARGVVCYEQKEINKSLNLAAQIQREQMRTSRRPLKNLSSKAKKQIKASPRAIWGLQHNWHVDKEVICSYTKILNSPVLLNGAINCRGGIYVTPNANSVATQIAMSAASNGLKTIIFVNTKIHSVSSAREIAKILSKTIHATPEESKRWIALEAELGGLQHSMLAQGAAAVPHNSAMLRLERELAESMFKRKDGSDIIIATPTLAQGLNLPADIAILAGDKRMNHQTGKRENLSAHELLNAAARAGRAGHLANGVVLLIPEPLLTFTEVGKFPEKLIRKLESILPDNDRCLTISDPLEVVLDKISEGSLSDPTVIYAINRLAELNGVGINSIFNINKSFVGYIAQKKSLHQAFIEKVRQLTNIVKQTLPVTLEKELLVLAAQSGLPASILSRLKTLIEDNIGLLPTSIPSWIDWFFNWLKRDHEARLYVLSDVSAKIMGIAGLDRNATLSAEGIEKIRLGVHGWISGLPLAGMETILKNASGKTDSLGQCNDARELVNNIIPRALVFSLGLVSQVVKSINPFDAQPTLDVKVIESLSSALRFGYDTPEKLVFSTTFRGDLSRIQIHKQWKQRQNTILDFHGE